MKRNKIVLTFSAVALTIASALAGRASVKNGPAPALYYTGNTHPGCGTIQASNITSSLLTTGGTSGSQATITTQGSSSVMRLYADASCSVKVRFHG